MTRAKFHPNQIPGSPFRLCFVFPILLEAEASLHITLNPQGLVL